MTRILRSFSAIALTALTMMAVSCGKKAEQKPSTLAKVACDESFENIMEQEIDVYEYIYPKEDVLAYYLS
ncbi:MAG: phosphate ABC transporter substrate-binding protein, partial [Duncaniella sp.]|nr:phosphate ABC transporter substrate-binding protein [Duncaniella sp.]